MPQRACRDSTRMWTVCICPCKSQPIGASSGIQLECAQRRLLASCHITGRPSLINPCRIRLRSSKEDWGHPLCCTRIASSSITTPFTKRPRLNRPSTTILKEPPPTAC
ncbi:hypothetical protein TcG_10430 [Trypanosoma cruzi]|nr:hypothetical protein TcG_10430 [Trypanosoma cruzi]